MHRYIENALKDQAKAKEWSDKAETLTSELDQTPSWQLFRRRGLRKQISEAKDIAARYRRFAADEAWKASTRGVGDDQLDLLEVAPTQYSMSA